MENVRIDILWSYVIGILPTCIISHRYCYFYGNLVYFSRFGMLY
jgi:hypothetical protein